MSEGRSHNAAANKIAQKLHAEYNANKGVDVVTPKMAVEVETETTVQDGIKQLQGHKKPAYIAGANQETIKIALKLTEGTTIGVMDKSGKVVKKSTRKKA